MGDIVRFVVRASGLFMLGLTIAVVGGVAVVNGKGIVAAAGTAWLMSAVVLSWPRLPEAWRNDPPTERQLAYATSLGIVVPPGASKGEVSEMISQITGR